MTLDSPVVQPALLANMLIINFIQFVYPAILELTVQTLPKKSVHLVPQVIIPTTPPLLNVLRAFLEDILIRQEAQIALLAFLESTREYQDHFSAHLVNQGSILLQEAHYAIIVCLENSKISRYSLAVSYAILGSTQTNMLKRHVLIVLLEDLVEYTDQLLAHHVAMGHTKIQQPVAHANSANLEKHQALQVVQLHALIALLESILTPLDLNNAQSVPQVSSKISPANRRAQIVIQGTLVQLVRLHVLYVEKEPHHSGLDQLSAMHVLKMLSQMRNEPFVLVLLDITAT